MQKTENSRFETMKTLLILYLCVISKHLTMALYYIVATTVITFNFVHLTLALLDPKVFVINLNPSS